MRTTQKLYSREHDGNRPHRSGPGPRASDTGAYPEGPRRAAGGQAAADRALGSGGLQDGDPGTRRGGGQGARRDHGRHLRRGDGSPPRTGPPTRSLRRVHRRRPSPLCAGSGSAPGYWRRSLEVTACAGSICSDRCLGKSSDRRAMWTCSWRTRPDVRPDSWVRSTTELELSAMVRRKVDLVSRAAVESSPNRVRRTAILSSARCVYAAG